MGGASTADISAARDNLISRQTAKGGWQQIPTREEDAYATGQALVALHVAGGLPTTSPIYQRGVRHLLDTQLADGSWLVPTRRRFPGLPYFETGYPHKQHQFISYAGAAWATMALTIAAKPGTVNALMAKSPRPRLDPPEDLAMHSKNEPILRAALRGSAKDVSQLLAAGADANAKGIEGATPLLYAVRDPEKVRLLLEHGANPNLASKHGTVPLIMAAGFTGPKAKESVRRLLKGGAKPNIARELYDSPLSMAIASGDEEMVRILIDGGAKMGPLNGAMAATIPNVSMLRFLIRQGLNVDVPLNKQKETMLRWAVADGSVEAVDILLELGADPNAIVEDAPSILMISAMCDPGHTRIIEALLKRGAKPEIATKEGKTALSLARKYGNMGAVRLLESR